MQLHGALTETNAIGYHVNARKWRLKLSDFAVNSMNGKSASALTSRVTDMNNQPNQSPEDVVVRDAARSVCPVYKIKGDISFYACPDVCDACVREYVQARKATNHDR